MSDITKRPELIRIRKVYFKELKDRIKALEDEVEKYKKVWMMAASLYDENGLAMPKDLMFKNFKDLDKEVLKWKVGYEKTKPRRGEMDG